MKAAPVLFEALVQKMIEVFQVRIQFRHSLEPQRSLQVKKKIFPLIKPEFSALYYTCAMFPGVSTQEKIIVG